MTSAGTSNAMPFTIAAQTFGLAVVKAGTGSGSITSAPAGIDCGTSCSSNFAAGMSVVLSAAPSNGSTASFTGCDTVAGGQCTVTLTATRTVTATFTPGSTPGGTTTGGAQSVIWTRVVNAAATGGTLTKTGGCNGCADSGGISVQKLGSGDGYFEFTAGPTGPLLFAGLTSGNPSTAGSGIRFAWRLGSGSADVRESNKRRATTTFVTGDRFRVSVEAGIVKYYKNGVRVYTSSQRPAYPLSVDAVLYSLGASVVNAVVLFDTAPPSVSITAPTAGANVTGPVSVSATATDNVGVTSVQFKLDGANLGAPVAAAPYTVSWDTSTAAAGSYTLTAVATDAAGNTATSAGVTVVVPSPPPTGTGTTGTGTTGTGTTGTGTTGTGTTGTGTTGTGTTSTSTPVTWTSIVNATATAGTLQKTSGCDGCPDAGGASQQTVASGNASLEFTATGVNPLLFAGLTGGAITTSADGIRFAWRLQGGWAEVREGNVYRINTAFVAGDQFRVSIETGVVRYYKNGTLIYTSGVAATYPLFADAALYNVGATVGSAVLVTP